jgi:hypothetical protein
VPAPVAGPARRLVQQPLPLGTGPAALDVPAVLRAQPAGPVTAPWVDAVRVVPDGRRAQADASAGTRSSTGGGDARGQAQPLPVEPDLALAPGAWWLGRTPLAAVVAEPARTLVTHWVTASGGQRAAVAAAALTAASLIAAAVLVLARRHPVG